MRSFRVKKEDWIINQSKAARSILHVGVTAAPYTRQSWEAGTLLHKKLCDEATKTGAKVVGVDIDKPSLEWLKEKMPDSELLYADAERLSDYFAPETRFDLIVAGDVIEHLSNPGALLTSCRSLLEPRGRVLVTTINAFGIGRFAKTLLGHEAVHPDHTTYYSHKTLGRLASMCGLQASSLGYYKCEPMTRFSWSGWITIAIEVGTAPFWPQLSEGITVEAVISSSTRD